MIAMTSSGFYTSALKDLLAPLPMDRASARWVDGMGDPSYRLAAVLVPIVTREDEHSLLLTQRARHLRNHAGQISFPGGSAEDRDESPVETALREAREEIGLDRQHVELIGTLPEYYTGSGFRVTPVVGFVHPPFDVVIDPLEVIETFEVPLTYILDPVNHEKNSVFIKGHLHRGHAFPYNGKYIWGMTAAVIMSLYQLLNVRHVPA